MSGEAVIVVYGVDPLLLETRVLLLEKAGYIAVKSHTLENSLDLISAWNVPLIVLCSSLSKAEIDSALAALEGLGRREIQRMILVKDDSHAYSVDQSKMFVTSLKATDFLSAVGDLMQMALRLGRVKSHSVYS